LILGLLAGLAGPAAAGEAPGLADLLPLLPDATKTTHSAPVFSYVDLGAVQRAAGIAPPASEAAFAAMPEDAQKAWAAAMRRVNAGPPDVLSYPSGIGRRDATSLEALGIDWFAIDAAMTFWQPPSTVTVLAGAPGFADPAAIGAALTARGFEERRLDGFTVWHKLDDNQLALDQKDPLADGDFLAGRIPRASRVAVGDDVVVHATNWPAIEAVAATGAGTAPASPAAALSEELLGAVATVTDADLLQATAFMLRDVGAANDPTAALGTFLTSPVASLEALRKAIMPEAPGPQLPLYPLALVADLQEGDEQLAVLALPYPGRASAEEAAIVVAGRLAAWAPNGGPPLVDAVRGTVEHHVVERDDIAKATFATFIASIEGGEESRKAMAAVAETTGGAAAVIVLRYPKADPAEPVQAGAAFRTFVAAIYKRAFTPLAAP
jgi:hypothetical protein